MSDRSPEMEAFVAEARGVGILDAFSRCGHSVSRLRGSRDEYVGPCPACGGKDRFSLNSRKNVFNCRGFGGGDAIGLAQHLTGADFLDACEILTGEPRPDRAAHDERERALRRREAERRLAEQRAKAEADEARQAADENAYRARELERCLGFWREGSVFAPGDAASRYLDARGLGAAAARIDRAYLRVHPRLGFFAKPEKGSAVLIHSGPAMLARFVAIGEGCWRPIGLHQTWLDLDAAPKFRPTLAHPETGELLPSKKMRGSKMGGLLPLIGKLSMAVRMVAGEGIETVLGFARFDGFRADTFYCAAGDLGNLCGKATVNSRFRHPTLRRAGKGGRSQPAWVPGFEPDMDAVCMPVPAHIRELVLLGDGDSDPVMTRAALRRGVTRHQRDERTVRSLFAPAGGDWADLTFEEEETA
ncbi:DUF7146 domain-containing protein [Aureimonas ureilytica]|nr:primase-helicase zinc-binding domain-containing protein [Aureimonas ureilytica]